MLGERPESGARRARWCDKAEERGGGVALAAKGSTEQEPEVNDLWESMGEGVSFCPQFRGLAAWKHSLRLS